MTEQFLHRTQVRTALQQVGRHRVPQAVRAQVRALGERSQRPVHETAHHPGIDPAAAVADEDSLTG